MTHQSLSRLERARLFLQYAYVSEPRWEVLDQFASEDFRSLKAELARLDRVELMRRMRDVAASVFERCFTGAGGEIVIPLSGGKDSRFILAMALELGLRDKVRAVTWGVPGGLDWELARKVATRMHVRQECVVTIEQQVSFSDLERAYCGGAQWTDLLLAHFNQAWRRIAPSASCAVIGYLGGPTIGSHCFDGDEQVDLDAAIRAFELANRKAPGRSCMIGDVSDRLIHPTLVSLPEQLDLVFRQEGYLRRIVGQESLGARTPFADRRWMRFMYALPTQARTEGNLFAEFVLRYFPHVFSTGVSGTYGLRIDAPHQAAQLRRKMLHLAYAAENRLRRRGLATFNKYGDARDLMATLSEAGAAPRAFLRALKARPENSSAAEAEAWRRRTMLVCNLACSLESEETRPALEDQAERLRAPPGLEFNADVAAARVAARSAQ